MKRIVLLSFLLAALVYNVAEAKEKKKSKKELAKEAAEDALLKPLRDKNAALEAQVAKLQEDKAQLLEDVNTLGEENKALQKEAMQMAQQQATAAPKAPTGLAFKIQLGAFANNVANLFSDDKTLQTESVDGKNKYVVGYFTDFADAKAAEKDFKKLGIKGTWLVPYKNGVRISDKEANNELNYDIRKAK